MSVSRGIEGLVDRAAPPETPRFSRHGSGVRSGHLPKEAAPDGEAIEGLVHLIVAPSTRLSLGRLLLSRACFRFTGIVIRDEQLPAASDALDAVARLELAQRVDDALHADTQIGAKIFEPMWSAGRPQHLEYTVGQQLLLRQL